MTLAGTFDRSRRTLLFATDEGGSSGDVRCRVAGHVFNEDALRQQYARPESSTAEVVAAVYRAHGADGIARLDGMFALALWDGARGHGVVAQDPLGVMSLFYAGAGDRLFFASEVGELLALLPAMPGADEVAIAHLLANSEPPPERTPYQGVSRLGGAHLLELDASGWRRRRYWWPRYQSPLREPQAELARLLWERVRESIRVRTADGARAGIIMSGGVDSSVVAAASVGVTDSPRGFSAVFPGRPELDESERIDKLVTGIALDNVQYEILPSGGIYAALEYLQRWSLPVPGPGLVLELPLVERAAADGVHVLLDGQGGNEVFGFSPYLLADQVRRGRLASSLRLSRQFPLPIQPAPWSQSLALWRMFGLAPAPPLALLELRRRMRRGLGPPYLQRRFKDIVLDTSDPFSWRRDSDGPLWWAYKVDVLLRGREQTRLSEYALHRAAAAGLDARPPLMDRSLVELSLTIPPELDFDRRWDRPLVREAMALGGVPDDVRLDRKKSDLGDFYFHLTTVTDFPFIRGLLADRDACLREYLTPAALADLTEKPAPGSPRGSRRWTARTWNFAIVETFLRHVRDPGSVPRMLESPGLTRPAARLHREHLTPTSNAGP